MLHLFLPDYLASANLLLFRTGPFPLSLLVPGINFIRKKVIPVWVAGLFCLGAITFPLNRITRTEWIAHIANLVLLVPSLVTGWLLVNQQDKY